MAICYKIAVRMRSDMVACFVVRPAAGGHEFLQLRRSPGRYLGGAWSTVRGGVEEGETAYDAAVRELREETGLVPLELYQLDTVDVFYIAVDDAVWHCPGFCAVVATDSAVTLNEEHDAHRWVPRSEIDTAFLWPGERSQLAELCREILDDGPAKPHLRIANAGIP